MPSPAGLLHDLGLPEKNSGHEGHTAEEKPVYTCPMHPEILRDAPGSCPICGMDLVKKETTPNMRGPDSLEHPLEAHK
ncbi:MAG: hypothetical protein IPM98_20320 [Lewinellaceae bacterium]|nr:hypothetical protein [Lewinellaceae bacterium]